jgi:16S rRNA (uracil1498-N3)-methyltransferase
VLRLKTGNEIIVFNGRGRERAATIRSLARRAPELSLGETLPALPESPAAIVLIQGLIKSDPMDMVVQKATELGVRRILAVETDFSVVKLDAERSDKRRAHWEKVARGACEQSRRHYPPEILPAKSLADSIAGLPQETTRIAFHKEAVARFSSLESATTSICLAVGPEGGFSPSELDQLVAQRFTIVSLGARTLRAETAAVAACSLAQLRWGDFA